MCALKTIASRPWGLIVSAGFSPLFWTEMEYGKARNPKQNLEFLHLPDVRVGEFINFVLHHS